VKRSENSRKRGIPSARRSVSERVNIRGARKYCWGKDVVKEGIRIPKGRRLKNNRKVCTSSEEGIDTQRSKRRRKITNDSK